MVSSTRNPFTLRFRDATLEAAYQADHERRSRPMVRAALVLGLLQYAGFGLLDAWVAPMAIAEIRTVRVVVCIIVALGIAATWSPRWRRWLQPALSVGLAGGLGVVAMEWAVHRVVPFTPDAPPTGLLILDGYYYSGLMLVLIYVHVLLRLSFVTATTIGGVLIACYLSVAALHTPPLRLANATLFLFSTQGSGMVASYALEWYARQAFVHARRQAEGHSVLRDALDRLTEAQTRLVQTEKLASLGRLTSGIAHELKNPLNFVVNFSDLSAEMADEARGALAADDRSGAEAALLDLRDNLRRIRGHATRADAIVARMQTHAGGASGPRLVVDLNAMVEEALHRAHAAAWHHDEIPCALHLDLAPDAGRVRVTPEALTRVLEGLVSNACDALGERLAGAAAGDGGPAPAGWAPFVRVATHRDGGTVTVSVADNGPGLRDDIRDHLFEPFVTTKPLGEGVGLSLSLARDVVEAHGGTLGVESEAGQGATFRLMLPLEPDAPGVAPDGAGAGRPETRALRSA